MSRLCRVLVALACAASCSLAQAQAWPAKPVRIIVPYAAGGGMDAFARTIGQRLSEPLRQPVLVENKPGASAIIGMDYVAKSPPDGYTLLLSDTNVVVNSYLFAKLPYDPFKDFAPITQLIATHIGLAVNPTLPVNSVRELIQFARDKPGQFNYSSVGPGSTMHLSMEMFQSAAGLKLTHVPYKGAAPALTDLAAGRVQMMFVSLGSALPLWRSGKIRIIAMGSPKRYGLYSDIPTVAEAGLSGFAVNGWFGLFAPAGTPREVVARTQAELKSILADPALREKSLDPQGFEAVVSSPEEFAEFTRTEAAKWGKVIRDANVRLE